MYPGFVGAFLVLVQVVVSIRLRRWPIELRRRRSVLSMHGVSVGVGWVCDGESDAMHFLFERFESGDDAYVTDSAAFWYVMEGNSLDSFGTIWSEAFEFVAPTLLPVVSVGALEEVSILKCGAGDWVGDRVGVEDWCFFWLELFMLELWIPEGRECLEVLGCDGKRSVSSVVMMCGCSRC